MGVRAPKVEFGLKKDKFGPKRATLEPKRGSLDPKKGDLGPKWGLNLSFGAPKLPKWVLLSPKPV